MKLGFVSAILANQTFEEVCDFASKNDYDCVEVMCWPKGKAERRYAGVTHIDVTDMTQQEADKVLEVTKTTGVEISGMGYYPNVLVPNEAEALVYVDHLKKVISAAKLLSVGVVTSFVGRDWTKNVDDNWPRFLKVWRDIIAFAEDNGIKIGIENCPMFFTNDEWPGGKNLATTPEIWRRMFSDIDSDSFGLNFDPSHMIWQHMDYLKAIREFALKFYHVHAKDVRIDKHRLDDVGIMANPSEYHTPKLPGMGDVNWGQFFSALTDSGYDGPVCVEVEDRAYEGSLKKCQTSLRQSAAYLRQFIQ